MKKIIIGVVATLVLVAAWLLPGCLQTGQAMETGAEIPAAATLGPAVIPTPPETDKVVLPDLNSKAAEDEEDIPADSSRGYIDVDQSGDFSEGDILLESNGENSYFLPEDYYSETNT